jgi:hypothetical protein
MPIETIAYIGAALMVVLAYLAYRYWRATAAYARRARESHAQRALESYQAVPREAPEPSSETPAIDPSSGVSDPDHESDADSTEEQTNGAGPVAGFEEAADELPPDEPDVEPAADDIPHEPPETTEDDTTEHADLHQAGDEVKAETAQEREILDPELRLIDELEPRPAATDPESGRELTERLKELDEEIAALPSGVELIDLPILERRRVADRRRELMDDRAHLLAQRKRGTHRRGRRRNRKPRDG